MKFIFSKGIIIKKDKTFQELIKTREKYLKKIEKNKRAIGNCKKCKKYVYYALKIANKQLGKRYESLLYNQYTKNALMRKIEKDRNLYHEQARLGVNVDSNCLFHRRKIRKAHIIFKNWLDVDRKIESLAK